jgi:hypothetical protein
MNSPETQSYPQVMAVRNIAECTRRLDALLLAPGFEDRAFNTLPNGEFAEDAWCILIRFLNSVPGNDSVFDKYLRTARDRFGEARVQIVELTQVNPGAFEKELSDKIAILPRTVRHFGVDISGMPSYAICMALKVVRDHRAAERVVVLYTAATIYSPTLTEYQKLNKRNPEEIEFLPKSMALEMDKNLILDSFSGYRSQNAKACLVVFAGYEAHRSTGVIEAVNPSLLLLLYGNPGDEKLAWRLELSKKLHRKFESNRRTATESISTLQVSDALRVLETYSNYLIDEYDMVISPICSKMHVVATYLFWEKYGETQLTFPIPIGYNPSRSPRGIGLTYELTIDPRRPIFGEPAESTATPGTVAPISKDH